MKPELFQSLLRADAYGHVAHHVCVIQTHISWVLLAGDFAYKIKKPVQFGFLDYSTLARRKEMCEREVQLNQRTCPDAYLGVVPIVERNGRIFMFGSGETIEYAVKMRRLPADGWLSSRVARRDATAELLCRVAESVHAFHATSTSGVEVVRFGSPSEVEAIWQENLEELAPFVGDTITSHDLEYITSFGRRFLRENLALMSRRVNLGRIRDGHGDLRADSVYVGADSHICLADSIEFSDRLRCGDVAGDVAFLAMDLDFRGRPDLADEFVGRYMELSPDDETLPCMLGFFRCHRAVVRGKVESITTREAEIGREQALEAHGRAVRYFALARRYATADVSPALIIVGGLSGTGKSHLAAALSGRFAAALVRSDAVRNEMFVAGGGRAAAVYRRDARARVYELARDRVRTHLEAGRTVVFDATHLERRDRDAARALAARLRVPAQLVWVDTPEEITRERLAERDDTPNQLSDARWDTYLAQLQEVEVLSELETHDCIKVDGAAPVTTNIELIAARLRQIQD